MLSRHLTEKATLDQPENGTLNYTLQLRISTSKDTTSFSYDIGFLPGVRISKAAYIP
jgi:hypothetical protein